MSLTVGDVLRVVATIVFLDGNVMQNVFAAVISGTGGPFDEDDVSADMLDWIDDMFANLVTFQSDNCDGSLVQIYVYDAVDDDFDEVGTESFVYNPSNTADEYARGVAALINAKTIDPDVSGKKYIGALAESHLTDGLIGSGLTVALTAMSLDWYTAFVGVASGATFTPGVWSPKNTNFFPLTGVFTFPTEPAYQRRRKRGVGA